MSNTRRSTSGRKRSPLFRTAAILAYAAILFLALEGGLRFGAVVSRWQTDSRNREEIRRTGVFRILCIGESTTALGGDDSYPSLLQKNLNERNLGVKFSVINGGRVGTTSTRLVASLEKDLVRYSPDLVVSMMGANDEGNSLVRQPERSKLAAGFESLRTVKLFRLLLRGGTDQGALPPAAGHLTLPLHTGQTGATNSSELTQLGMKLKTMGAAPDAEAVLLKAIGLNPSNDEALCELGDFYEYRNKPELAESCFSRAIAANPANDRALIEKAYLRFSAGETNASNILLQKALACKPDSDWARGRLAASLACQGLRAEAERQLAIADMIRSARYNPATETSYRSLARILQEAGVPLVCAQYPVRSPERLRKMLAGCDDVVIAGNEEPFKSALLEGDTVKYFTDLFGGEFGHCTPAGNRAIADNIAAAIVAGFFKGQSSP